MLLQNLHSEFHFYIAIIPISKKIPTHKSWDRVPKTYKDKSTSYIGRIDTRCRSLQFHFAGHGSTGQHRLRYQATSQTCFYQSYPRQRNRHCILAAPTRSDCIVLSHKEGAWRSVTTSRESYLADWEVFSFTEMLGKIYKVEYAQSDCHRGSKSAAPTRSSKGRLWRVISTPLGRVLARAFTSKYSYFVSSRTKGVDLNQLRCCRYEFLTRMVYFRLLNNRVDHDIGKIGKASVTIFTILSHVAKQ